MIKSNVYTRTGDTGTTALVGGSRVKKNDIRLEAYGTVDELMANLGHLSTRPDLDVDAKQNIITIQNHLFNIGAYLATPPSNEPNQFSNPGISEQNIAAMEEAIDNMDSHLPALHSFVLPGGSRTAAIAHICRTVCRRCERRIIDLDEVAIVDPIVIRYINRLSDYLFVFSRYINLNNVVDEIYWDKNA